MILEQCIIKFKKGNIPLCSREQRILVISISHFEASIPTQSNRYQMTEPMGSDDWRGGFSFLRCSSCWLRPDAIITIEIRIEQRDRLMLSQLHPGIGGCPFWCSPRCCHLIGNSISKYSYPLFLLLSLSLLSRLLQRSP